MCKAHYKECQLSQRNNDTEQGAADLASFSESAQRAVAREEPCVQEHKSAQQAVAREEPGVREHESAQQAAARATRTFDMACKYVDEKYIFHQTCRLWNAPCVHGCGYLHLSSSTPGSRKYYKRLKGVVVGVVVGVYHKIVGR